MVPLSQMSRGIAVCRQVEGDGTHTTRLKRLGICEGRSLEVMQAGDPMILRVIGTSIGLSRQLASLVLVETPVAHPTPAPHPVVPAPFTKPPAELLATAKQ